MALNLDTTFKLKAQVVGAKSVDNFKKQLKGLDTSSKMSKVQLGKMNIEINRMARAAGNTTRGLREHIRALTALLVPFVFNRYGKLFTILLQTS